MYRTNYVVSIFLCFHSHLVRFLLCEGPIDVTFGILGGVEGLMVGLIEREVLFQLVWQIGL